MPQLRFCGHDFRIVGGTALHWLDTSALIVADLHLEKASWFAARGQMLPPHDSQATLERLAQLISATDARAVFCLGDNFHDDTGPDRLAPDARLILARLTQAVRWTWITGNHDAALPAGIGGSIADEVNTNGLILRHQADPDDPRPELSGHFHPKYRARSQRGAVTRPCFVASASKIILPAFGALTGGLHAHHDSIVAAVGDNCDALVATATRLLRFPLKTGL